MSPSKVGFFHILSLVLKELEKSCFSHDLFHLSNQAIRICVHCPVTECDEYFLYVPATYSLKIFPRFSTQNRIFLEFSHIICSFLLTRIIFPTPIHYPRPIFYCGFFPSSLNFTLEKIILIATYDIFFPTVVHQRCTVNYEYIRAINFSLEKNQVPRELALIAISLACMLAQ